MLHQRVGDARGCRGVPWWQISHRGPFAAMKSCRMMVSLEQLKEIMSKRTLMQPQDDMRGARGRVIEDTKRDAHWCKRVMTTGVAWRGRANVECIVTHEREARDLRKHDSRTRLAETCRTRDESPSSNLGRVQQEATIRADVMKPTVGGRDPRWRMA